LYDDGVTVLYDETVGFALDFALVGIVTGTYVGARTLWLAVVLVEFACAT
jgi:hypothetical protein